jgi:hypothetical protein
MGDAVLKKVAELLQALQDKEREAPVLTVELGGRALPEDLPIFGRRHYDRPT